jgi:thioredoxin 1
MPFLMPRNKAARSSVNCIPPLSGATMKSLIAVTFSMMLMGFATLALSAEVPFNQAQFDSMRAAGKPVAVVFHADWCPTCRAQAPVLKDLSQTPELKPLTLFVANYDTEKALKKSLEVTQQSTIVVFKDGKESARSTGDTQRASLEALLRHAIS